uniref:Uncharacterized protein n=1 Tax=Tetranychus urticae TaxID=32264 RepID=T1K3W7_TETUR
MINNEHTGHPRACTLRILLFMVDVKLPISSSNTIFMPGLQNSGFN